MANGYSSMVFDQRIFVSFNPCAQRPVHLHRIHRRVSRSHRAQENIAARSLKDGSRCQLRAARCLRQVQCVCGAA